MSARVRVAVVVSAAVSLAGWRTRALTGRGAVAATAVGTGVIGGCSWPGAVVLGTFFVSASGLSRLARPSPVAAKGSRRDERQVLANGAVAAVAALLGGRIDRRLGLGMAAGALAAATADTWATEIGSTSRQTPRLIISGRFVERGASGAVTSRGSLAALCGSAVVAAVTGIVSDLSSNAK
ncbi:MAG: DUF92 domain-containing protein, partial [Vicinamibacterales bacterium]